MIHEWAVVSTVGLLQMDSDGYCCRRKWRGGVFILEFDSGQMCPWDQFSGNGALYDVEHEGCFTGWWQMTQMRGGIFSVI